MSGAARSVDESPAAARQRERVARTAGPRRRGSLGQRIRARGVAGVAGLMGHLPAGPVEALADAAGDLWYRIAPERASLGRRNLQRVVRSLADRGLGGPRVAAAAVDGAALERLLRSAFRHAARYYLDLARLPGQDPAAVIAALDVETPEVVDRAFGSDMPTILVAMHFGAIEYPAIFAVARSGEPILTPMETLSDPELQDWIRRTRAVVGVEIVGLREARRALFAALKAGRMVGLVADRHVAGAAIDVPFFGVPAPLPVGPALLAVETGRPLYVGAVRRLVRPGHAGARFAGRLYPVATATTGDRKQRVRDTTAAIAAVMELAIAAAPEQWWSIFAPIWPDLDPRAVAGTGRMEPQPSEAQP